MKTCIILGSDVIKRQLLYIRKGPALTEVSKDEVSGPPGIGLYYSHIYRAHPCQIRVVDEEGEAYVISSRSPITVTGYRTMKCSECGDLITNASAAYSNASAAYYAFGEYYCEGCKRYLVEDDDGPWDENEFKLVEMGDPLDELK